MFALNGQVSCTLAKEVRPVRILLLALLHSRTSRFPGLSVRVLVRVYRAAQGYASWLREHAEEVEAEQRRLREEITNAPTQKLFRWMLLAGLITTAMARLNCTLQVVYLDGPFLECARQGERSITTHLETL